MAVKRQADEDGDESTTFYFSDEAFLQDSDVLFKAITRNLPVGLIIVNDRGRIVFMNPYAENLFGYKPGELLDQSIEQLLPQHLRTVHQHHRDSYFALPRTRLMFSGQELIGIHQNGSEIPLQIGLSYVKTNAGLIGVAYLTELGELKQLERVLRDNQTLIKEQHTELIEVHKRLQWVDQMKVQFAHHISHELRTPLTNLQLYLNLLQQGRPDKRADYMAVLQTQTQRLLQSVERISNLIELATISQEVQFEKLQVNQLVERAVNTMLPEAQHKGLRLEYTLHENNPVIWGQVNQLDQAISFVLENAVHYTETGHVVCQVITQDEKVCISIQDTGRGIDADDLPYIFDSFFRGQNVSNLAGIGLGLTLAQEIIQLYHGNIEVDSQLNVGSTFNLWLPWVKSYETVP